ncbi:MAG: hypothetical protein KJ906_02755 [Nanoarchaeota archaeon]|nr:hypothetical protein [Nanoarchaeota archaeon]
MKKTYFYFGIFVVLCILFLLTLPQMGFTEAKSVEDSLEFEVDQTLLKILVKNDETTSVNLRVMNVDDEIIGIAIQPSYSMEDIVSISDISFDIKPGQTKIVKLTISGKSRDLEYSSGVYTGKILIKAGTSIKEVPIIVEIESKYVLFDTNINTETENRNVVQGDVYVTEIKLFNLMGQETTSVNMEYYIKDLDDNTIITESESVVVSTQATFTKVVNIPSNLKLGTYIFAVNSNYGSSVGTSSYLFYVVESDYEASNLISSCIDNQFCLMGSFALIIVIFTITAFIYLIIHIRRPRFKLKVRRKHYFKIFSRSLLGSYESWINKRKQLIQTDKRKIETVRRKRENLKIIEQHRIRSQKLMKLRKKESVRKERSRHFKGKIMGFYKGFAKAKEKIKEKRQRLIKLKLERSRERERKSRLVKLERLRKKEQRRRQIGKLKKEIIFEIPHKLGLIKSKAEKKDVYQRKRLIRQKREHERQKKKMEKQRQEENRKIEEHRRLIENQKQNEIRKKEQRQKAFELKKKRSKEIQDRKIQQEKQRKKREMIIKRTAKQFKHIPYKIGIIKTDFQKREIAKKREEIKRKSEELRRQDEKVRIEKKAQLENKSRAEEIKRKQMQSRKYELMIKRRKTRRASILKIKNNLVKNAKEFNKPLENYIKKQREHRKNRIEQVRKQKLIVKRNIEQRVVERQKRHHELKIMKQKRKQELKIKKKEQRRKMKIKVLKSGEGLTKIGRNFNKSLQSQMKRWKERSRKNKQIFERKIRERQMRREEDIRLMETGKQEIKSRKMKQIRLIQLEKKEKQRLRQLEIERIRRKKEARRRQIRRAKENHRRINKNKIKNLKSGVKKLFKPPVVKIKSNFLKKLFKGLFVKRKPSKSIEESEVSEDE